MNTSLLTPPLNADADAKAPVPGISAAEVNSITSAATRFLTRTDPGSRDASTNAITLQVANLVLPYVPADVGAYNCAAPNGTHWCDGH